ncbi:hypothetical protein Lal_00033455 [Lupinus albus]|nr:hypothetical protein Lal_00033455 [Lupinus albus]
MSFENEVKEEGTMVNTQTPITPQTQKHKPRGITALKSVVHSISNNNKLTVEWNTKGQPLKNKGGNKLVSYIGVVVRKNVSIKFKHWSDERLNAVKDIIWKDITCNCIPCCRDPIFGWKTGPTTWGETNSISTSSNCFGVATTFFADKMQKNII